MANGYVGIPILYTPIEYIESTGAQYIDTGYKANINTKIILEAAYSGSVTGTNYQQITGGRDSYHASSAIQCAYRTDTELVLVDYGTSGTSNYISVPRLEKFTVQIANQNIKVNDTAYTQSGTFSGTSNYSLWIFDDNAAGSTEKNFTGRIYSYKIFESNTLIHDFIPVLDENNVACLYEQVEGKFYYNVGSGTFTAGSATGQPVSIGDRARKLKNGYVGTPISYTPVEYVESDGTQYIDTGIVPKSTTRMIYDFANTNNSQNNRIGWGSSGNQEAFECGSTLSEGKFMAASSSNTTYVWLGNVDLNRHIFDISNQAIKFDNVSYGTGNIGDTATAGQTIFLFAFHAEWTAAPQYVMSKLYSCKIYDGDTLVRDFTPAVDQDNVACLYEQVENKFYYNQGMGTFTAGSTTGQPVSLGDKARRIIRGYVGVNGVAKLCFGSFIPRYSTAITDAVHTITPGVANTTDYIIVAGGQTTNGANPVKAVTAYSSSLVATQAPDMPTQSSYQGACGFNGYAIIASGKSGSSGSSRTNQVLAYSNNLTRSTLATLSTSVFESTATSNNVHCIVQGGTRYDAETSFVTSYDTNFTKTMPTGMSVVRRNHSSAAVGDYIVCCGAFNTRGNVDFYDNTNVRTTIADPYGKNCNNPLGIGTNAHAIFFGGGTSQNASTAYSDCKAFDQNKVLTSFALPQAVIQAQGFSTGDYAFVAFRFDSYVYDDNLVLVEHATHDGAIYGYSVGTQGAATDSFAIIHQDWATSLRIITM